MKKEDPPASLVAMNYNGGSITLNIHLSSSSEKHPSKNLCHHPSRAKRLTQCLTCFEIPFLRVQARLIRVIYGDSDRLSDKYCNPETKSLHLYHKKIIHYNSNFAVILRMARQCTKSKFIFCKMFIKFNICGSYNLTNNIYLTTKKMAKKEKKRVFIHIHILLFCWFIHKKN